jgi:hypothetical protein
MKVLKIKNWTYQDVRLAEASSLVCLDMRKSNCCSSKSDLWIFGLVLLVFWYLWYFWYNSFLVLLVLCETRVSLSGRSSH